MNVEIYSKFDCKYCSAAKSLLEMRNISFKEHVLDSDFTREFLLEKFSTAKTFPVIVVDGFYIGGYTDLRNLLEQQSTNQKLLNE